MTAATTVLPFPTAKTAPQRARRPGRRPKRRNDREVLDRAFRQMVGRLEEIAGAWGGDRSRLMPSDVLAGGVFTILVAGHMAKACLFLDLATRRVFARVGVLDAAEIAIPIEALSEAFAEMFSDSRWGVPATILVERGSELEAAMSPFWLAEFGVEVVAIRRP